MMDAANERLAMRLQRLKLVTREVKREIVLWRSLLSDGRTPLVAKLLLGLALGYLLLPFDLIPDFIPVLGQLDDVLIVPGLVLLARRFIPDELIQEHRLKQLTG
jgi:uncharacterized membrane protein YkvA (DUF1232 family)